MRIAVSIFVWLVVLLSGGCAIWEKETTNRGGFLDHVLDEHWLKAHSKGMRALRAFAIQVSLARIASVSAKNDSDRQLLAIRIGALTKRFSPIYACAFDTNPLGVPGVIEAECPILSATTFRRRSVPDVVEVPVISVKSAAPSFVVAPAAETFACSAIADLFRRNCPGIRKSSPSD